MNEHELLCWLKDYKGYYNLDVITITISDKTFRLNGYANEKLVKTYEKEISKK